MPGSMGVVYTVATAERIERIRPHRVLAAGKSQSVDNPVAADRRQAEPLELRIDEADVEGGVVGDPTGIAEEIDDFLGDIGEGRLVLQELVGDTVDGQRFRVNLALPGLI